MALKTILFRKRLTEKEKDRAALQERAAAAQKREEELAAAIEEAEKREDLDDVEELVNEVEAERADVKQQIEAIDEEIAALKEQIAEAEAAQEEAAEASEEESENNEGEARSRRRGEKRTMNRMTNEAAAEFKRTGHHVFENVRGLIQTRTAITTGTTGVIGPVGVDGINDPVAMPSTLADLVNLVDATGMSSYKVAVEVSDSAADDITEGSAATESEPVFATVTFTPGNYGLMSYVSKEIRKQSPLNYEEKVTAAARRALRRKVNKLVAAAVPASSLADTYDLVAANSASDGSVFFDASLLSNIILAYGGDEGVDGSPFLVLNKKDLKAFAAVRGTNEFLPVYSIIPNEASPSTGIIKDNNGLSCRYVLSKDVTALCDVSLTTSFKTTMFFCNLGMVDVPLWGGYDVSVSEDYKFAEGLLSVRGEVSADADLVAQGGAVIVRAKKAASA